MNYPKSFTDLVECFKRLPGIGGKSAERLAYHVLSMDKEYVQEFANVLAHFQDNIHVKNVDIFVKVNFVKFVKMKQGINQLFVL